MRASWRQTRGRMAPAACLVVAMCLAGCVENYPNAASGPGEFKAVAQGDAPSPRAAAMAFASIDGAPEPVVARFRTAVATEAANRQITLADPSLARYFVRGYLDAYATDQGTAIRYVWDVYDSAKQRTQRLDDGVDIPGSIADPWSALDDKVLGAIASRSAESIAGYLATTPEAAGSRPSGPAAPAGQSAQLN